MNEGILLTPKEFKRSIEVYPTITNPPKPTTEFIENTGVAQNSHDIIDITMLYAVYQNVVDFFITEDRKLIWRAAKVNLGDRVMGIREGLEFFSIFFKKPSPLMPPYITKGKVSDLVDYLPSEFFNSFREDYSKFDGWFKRKARDRVCYYIQNNGNVSAIMILKEETESLELKEKILNTGKRLKICSLKVSDSQSNVRIFEKLLSLAFIHAYYSKLESVYVTVYVKHANLIEKLGKFGFHQSGLLKDTSEYLFEKDLIPIQTFGGFEYVKKYYPNYRDDYAINKYIIPVMSLFHKRLFPEYPTIQMSIIQYDSRIPVGNAIIKVYLSKSRVTKLRSGGLLLFYRSREERGITSIGVIEETRRFYSLQDLVDYVGNRSVYTKEDLMEMISPSGVMCVKFWLVRHLNRLVTPVEMKNADIEIPQSIMQVDDERYKRISNLWMGQ